MDYLDGSFNRGYTKAIIDLSEIIDSFYKNEKSKKRYWTALHSFCELLKTDSWVRDEFRIMGIDMDWMKLGVIGDAKTGKVKRRRNDDKNSD